MSRARVTLALSLLFCLPPAARAEDAVEASRVLRSADVVSAVRAKNPSVQAALQRVESTRQDVLRLDARYVPVVVLDGSASDITTPSLFTSGISQNRVRRADVGAEARKHLLWGTDLSLRVSGNVQENEFKRPGSSGSSVGGVVPGGASGPLTFTPSGSFGPGYGWLAKFTLKQPLLRGRGRDIAEAELNAARESRDIAERGRERVVSETLRDALIAYWELWYAHSALVIQNSAREVAARQVSDASARVNTGSLAPVEVLAFETEFAAREEDVVRAEAEERRALLELLRLLGEEAPEVAVAPSSEAPDARAAPPAEQAEQSALSESAELQESAANLKLNEVQARTASDALRQRLDLDAYAQVQGLANRDSNVQAMLGSRTATVYGAFVGLSYEIPTSRRGERAASARARADVHEAEAQLLAVRQRVLSDVRKALTQHTSGQRAVALAERTREIAGRQEAAEMARFDSGTGTSLQVIQATDKRRAAELRVARAQADLAQSALRLDHLTGQLLARVAR